MKTDIAGWLDEIERADMRHVSAQGDLEIAVERAKDAGATWEAIGGTLGISRQAAQQRFG